MQPGVASMNQRRVFPQRLAFAVAGGGVLFYALACHYLGFLSEPWLNRAILLALFWPPLVLLIYLLAGEILNLGQGLSCKSWIVRSGIGILAALLLLPFTSRALPPFPATHTLQIEPQCAAGREFQVLWINRLNLPSRHETALTPDEVQSSGAWQAAQNGWYTDCKQPSTLSYTAAFQGGVRIGFKAIPQQHARVQVVWDGRARTLDLYAPGEELRTLSLEQNAPWSGLSVPWKLLILALWICDALTVALLGFLAAFLLVLLYRRRQEIAGFIARRPKLALALPLLMLAGLALNLATFGQGNILHRLAGNTIADLAQDSPGKNGYYPVYFYFLDHFRGRTLVAAPDLFDEVELSASSFRDFSSIGQVVFTPYRIQLSADEAAALRRLPGLLIPAQTYSTYDFRFLETPAERSGDLCLQQYGTEIMVGSLRTLPGCQEAP